MRWSLRTEEDLARWIGKKRQRLRVAQCPECGTRSNWVMLKLERCQIMGVWLYF